MKVVFDTNVFVSALTLPGGGGDRALRQIIDGEDSIALSRAIIDELLSVLARKFARDPEELARIALFVSDLGELVEPADSISVLADEPDNRILECARAAGADVIVTGDRAMLAAGEFEGVRIVSRGLPGLTDRASRRSGVGCRIPLSADVCTSIIAAAPVRRTTSLGDSARPAQAGPYSHVRSAGAAPPSASDLLLSSGARVAR